MAKSKKNKKNKGRKATIEKKPYLSFFIKWTFVFSLWFILFAGAYVLWLARDLPQIISSPSFDRKSAIIFYDDSNNIVSRYGEMKGQSISVDELPDHLINAVLAIEDRRFYEHFGIDLIGFSRAMFINLKNRRFVQGGSTITQQLAKNLFLSHEKTINRKIKEAILAIWMERQLSKDEILSAYLNRVYLGSGAYGVDAASNIYFNKSASQLNLQESAIIAGLLKAPSRYSPKNNPDIAKARAQVVINAMVDAGYIDAKTKQAKAPTLPHPKNIYKDAKSERYFTDWSIDNINELVPAETSKNDLRIYTTLDRDIQKHAEKALVNIIKKHGNNRDFNQGAIIIMRNDGAIIAMVGGKNYKQSQFNRATQAYRPSGSAFKPILYLSALENGWSSKSIIMDAPVMIGDYQPKNFNNEYNGEVPLSEALAKSMNSAAIRLVKDIGVKNTIKTARKLGISAKLNKDPSIALGSSGIPLIELVTAYATISNQGNFIEPYSIRKVTDNDGDIIYSREPTEYSNVVSSSKARSITKMLGGVIENGTGKNARINAPAAGKTGTSQDYRDALFVGFSHPFICAVWLGNDDNSPMNKVTGGSFPAIIWNDVMTKALSTKEKHKDIIDDNSSNKFSSFLSRFVKNTSKATYND